jgi:hypothetical protein
MSEETTGIIENNIVEEKIEETKPEMTAISVTKVTAERLMRMKNHGDSYEDVLKRVLDQIKPDQ